MYDPGQQESWRNGLRRAKLRDVLGDRVLWPVNEETRVLDGVRRNAILGFDSGEPHSRSGLFHRQVNAGQTVRRITHFSFDDPLLWSDQSVHRVSEKVIQLSLAAT